MAEDILSKQVYYILQNYKIYREEKGYIDYYNIFGLSSTDSLEEIRKNIEEQAFSSLFQFDKIPIYKEFLGDTLGKYYEELCICTSKLSQDFKCIGRKILYDMQLENARKRESLRIVSSLTIPTREEMELQSILEENMRFGFSHLFKVLQDMYYLNIDQIFFTKTGNSKRRAKTLGQETIQKIMESHLIDTYIYKYRTKQIVFDYIGYLLQNSEVLKDYVSTFIEVYLHTMQKANAYGLPHYMLRALDEYVQTNFYRSFKNVKNTPVPFYESFKGNDLFVFMELYFNQKRDIYPNLAISALQHKLDQKIITEKEIVEDFYKKFGKEEDIFFKTYCLK